MEATGIKNERLGHLTAIGLSLPHLLKVGERVGMQGAGGNRRGGGVPVAHGHGCQCHALDLAVNVEFGHLDPIVDA